MATALTRWDPAAELANMRSVMDRVLDQSFGRLPAVFRNGEELGPATLGLDVYETSESFVVKTAVPGIAPEKVDISIDDDVLSIRGEHEEGTESGDENYLRRELRWGSFQRSLRLPPTVDADNADARFEHGVLTLTLPKKPEARARSIKITPHA